MTIVSLLFSDMIQIEALYRSVYLCAEKPIKGGSLKKVFQ